MLTAILFTIRQGSPLDREISPGSGVVGTKRDGGLLLHFEGNQYGASNLHNWRERTLSAAGRMFARYPTTAMRFVPAEQVTTDLIPVGSVTADTPQSGYRIDVENTEELNQYVARYQGH